MRRINNITDLDKQLAEVEAAFAISDDEGRRVMDGFEYVIDYTLPKDPTSEEYFSAQTELYRQISGRESYDALQDEATSFDFESLKDAPFPYCTQSGTTVGYQLIGQGYLIRSMALPPGSHIVEFGPGWGNTTLHLLQMGYRMTAVDVEQKFLDIIGHRASLVNKEVELIRQDMLKFDSDQQYDAALFFECFHHCSNHIRLIQQLHKLIKDDGVIVFGGEPIVEHWPVPWGIRLDGMSVWSIRKFGWLELGFNTSYFLRLLLHLGWIPKHHISDFGQITNVIVAHKSKLLYCPSQMTLPPDEDKTWAIPETDPNIGLRFALKKSVMSVSKQLTPKTVEFCLTNFAPRDLQVTLWAGDASQEITIPAGTASRVYTVPVQNWNGKVMIDSETWQTKKAQLIRYIPNNFIPHRILQNIDQRILGTAVHSVRLIE